MNKSLFQVTAKIILLIGLCLQFCYAQVSNTPTFCWMVLSKEDKTPSFVFGTVHHMGPKPILNNKQLISIILNSKLIVEESDTTEEFHPEEHHFDLTCDTPLDEILGFADYQFVKNNFFHATGKNLEDYKYRMPQVIMLMIEHGREDQKEEQDKMPLMENALYAISVIKRIPIEGLETRKENFDIMFRSMPLKDQADLLMYDLKDLQFNNVMQEISACFERQDLDCICSIEDVNHYTRPGDSTIIVKRNLFWMPKIIDYIRMGKVFIAVGAAHLCGDLGIISLLKKEGYTIVPVLTN